jgi:hypothetical protein
MISHRILYRGKKLSDPFILTIDTTKAGSVNTHFVLPCTGAGYNFTYDHGDGNTTTHTGTPGDIDYTYSVSGMYTIKIRGTFPRIFFNDTGDKSKVLSIDHWGPIVWSSFEGAFYGCGNMVGNYTDTPNLSVVGSMSQMFRGCSLFNSSVTGWDTSGVLYMFQTFCLAVLFNQPVPWNTSNVVNMTYMFNGASAFNQLLSFDFSSAGSLKQFLIWCSAYKQSLAAWDISSITEMLQMMWGVDLNETGTTTNYDDTLISWAAQAVQSGVVFDAGNSKYSAANGKPARDILTGTYGWTINDGGQA